MVLNHYFSKLLLKFTDWQITYLQAIQLILGIWKYCIFLLNHQFKTIVIILNVKSVQHNYKLSLKIEYNKANKKETKDGFETGSYCIWDANVCTEPSRSRLRILFKVYKLHLFIFFTYKFIYQIIWMVENYFFKGTLSTMML